MKGRGPDGATRRCRWSVLRLERDCETARIAAARATSERRTGQSHGSRWVGIDLHRRRSQIAVVDEQGELTLSRRIINDRATLLEVLAGGEGETNVTLEA